MSRKRRIEVIDNEEERDDSPHLSILEAVENLSNIAEMEGGAKLGFLDDQIVVQDSEDAEEGLETIQWLEDKSEHQTEEVVEETYRAVLKYVKDFHQKEFNRFYDNKNQEGIKKIMLLVGKASEKLDKYTHLFKGTHVEGIEDTKEYKQLNKFYNERIAIEDEDKVSLIDLSRKERHLDVRDFSHVELDEKVLQSKKFVLNVERVKEDKNYELLYLTRDDGSRYLEPNFYRNIKAACNFSQFVGKRVEIDPLEGLRHWLDLSLHKSAISILKLVTPYAHAFFKEAVKYKDMEIVSNVNMALMALMLARSSKNRSNLNPAKSCTYFFYDFQHYLREVLASYEYHKLSSFPPPATQVFLHSMMKMINLLSWASYFHAPDFKSHFYVIDDMLEEGKVAVRKKAGQKVKEIQNIWKAIEEDYLHIQRYLMNYPVGPLYTTLQQMSEGQENAFDQYHLGNIPMEYSNFDIGELHLSLLRMPSPTYQGVVNKVQIDREFIGLMDAYEYADDEKKHLLINLQDRTHWSEYSRAELLEKMPKQAEYVQFLNTVTFSKSSDFYHQIGAYQNFSKTNDFIKQLVFHLHSKETGYYFPDWIEEKIFSGFVEKLVQNIHRFFFEGKSTLKQKERQQFIDIFYQFLYLKIIELSKPTSMSFTCKDAIDAGAVETVFFTSFLKLVSGEEVTQKDREKMYLMLFTFPILVRNRATHAEGFLRMVHTLEFMQNQMEKHSKGQVKKVFNELYDLPFDQIKFRKMQMDQVLTEEEEE